MKIKLSTQIVCYVLLTHFIATTCDAQECPVEQIPQYANKPVVVINDSAWTINANYAKAAMEVQPCAVPAHWILEPGKRTTPQMPCTGCSLTITGPDGYQDTYYRSLCKRRF